MVAPLVACRSARMARQAVTVRADGSSFGAPDKNRLMKITYGYFQKALLPCPHPASKDSRSSRPDAALRTIRYDLSEDVTPHSGG